MSDWNVLIFSGTRYDLNQASNLRLVVERHAKRLYVHFTDTDRNEYNDKLRRVYSVH